MATQLAHETYTHLRAAVPGLNTTEWGVVSPTMRNSSLSLGIGVMLSCGGTPPPRPGGLEDGASPSTSDSATSTGGTTDGKTTDPTMTGTGDPTGDTTDPNDTGDEDDDSSTGTGTEDPPLARAVDVLLVVDNSGSMARHAARVAYDLNELVDHLTQFRVSVRLAVTTTYSPHVICPPMSPDSGQFRLSSCRERLNDFIFDPGGVKETDARIYGCTDWCELETLSLEPTSTHLEPDPRPHDWIEVSNVATNLPANVSVANAIACAVPQGINGCGFEAPLESIRNAMISGEDSESPNYGFWRPDALLVVLVVTDELDCSAADMAIFEDNKTFWVEPTGTAKSGICWKAGVACTGDGNPYDECIAEDYDATGNPDASDEDAVLFPLSRYTELFDPTRSIVFGLTGVPPGFGFGDAEIEYVEPVDQMEKIDFGVAPGCTLGEAWARPPVRLRELAHYVDDERNLFSICRESHQETMAEITRRVLERI